MMFRKFSKYLFTFQLGKKQVELKILNMAPRCQICNKKIFFKKKKKKKKKNFFKKSNFFFSKIQKKKKKFFFKNQKKKKKKIFQKKKKKKFFFSKLKIQKKKKNFFFLADPGLPYWPSPVQFYIVDVGRLKNLFFNFYKPTCPRDLSVITKLLAQIFKKLSIVLRYYFAIM